MLPTRDVQEKGTLLRLSHPPPTVNYESASKHFRRDCRAAYGGRLRFFLMVTGPFSHLTGQNVQVGRLCQFLSHRAPAPGCLFTPRAVHCLTIFLDLLASSRRVKSPRNLEHRVTRRFVHMRLVFLAVMPNLSLILELSYPLCVKHAQQFTGRVKSLPYLRDTESTPIHKRRSPIP